MIDSAVEKREMEHKHALIQQRVSPGAAALCKQHFSPSVWLPGSQRQLPSDEAPCRVSLPQLGAVAAEVTEVKVITLWMLGGLAGR